MNVLQLVLYVLEVHSVAFYAPDFALGTSFFCALRLWCALNRVRRLGHSEPLKGVVLEENLVEEAVQRSHLREVLIVGLRASGGVDADVVAFPEHLQDRLSEDVLMLDR